MCLLVICLLRGYYAASDELVPRGVEREAPPDGGRQRRARVGGGVMLAEAALKSSSNLYNVFRRLRTKTYQMKDEVEAAAEVTEVPAPAGAPVGVLSSQRRRTPVVQSSVELQSDDDKKK
eukprot:1692834-Pleurochrysis_carterae.AAC.1